MGATGVLRCSGDSFDPDDERIPGGLRVEAGARALWVGD